MARIENFDEFWPFYVSQHRKHGTRVLHFAGSTAGILFFAAAVLRARPLFLLYGLAAGYCLAWVGHFFIEKNRPATFEHPVWSFLGDWKMYGLMWRGKMSAEVERLGYAERTTTSASAVSAR